MGRDGAAGTLSETTVAGTRAGMKTLNVEDLESTARALVFPLEEKGRH